MPLSWTVNKFTALNSTTVKANSNVIDWDAYATTTIGYSTNFTATMNIVQTDLQCMFGLTPNTNPQFSGI